MSREWRAAALTSAILSAAYLAVVIPALLFLD